MSAQGSALAPTHTALKRCGRVTESLRSSCAWGAFFIHAAAAVLILALCAAPVNAQDGRLPTIADKPTIWLVALGDCFAVGEIVSSEAGIQQGTTREANALLGGHTDEWATARRALLKASGQAVSTWAILRYSRTTPDDPHRDRKRWVARGMAVAKVVFNGYLMRRALDYQGPGINPSND